jgi:hypothetical protein
MNEKWIGVIKAGRPGTVALEQEENAFSWMRVSRDPAQMRQCEARYIERRIPRRDLAHKLEYRMIQVMTGRRMCADSFGCSILCAKAPSKANDFTEMREIAFERLDISAEPNAICSYICLRYSPHP